MVLTSESAPSRQKRIRPERTEERRLRNPGPGGRALRLTTSTGPPCHSKNPAASSCTCLRKRGCIRIRHGKMLSNSSLTLMPITRQHKLAEQQSGTRPTLPVIQRAAFCRLNGRRACPYESLSDPSDSRPLRPRLESTDHRTLRSNDSVMVSPSPWAQGSRPWNLGGI